MGEPCGHLLLGSWPRDYCSCLPLARLPIPVAQADILEALTHEHSASAAAAAAASAGQAQEESAAVRKKLQVLGTQVEDLAQVGSSQGSEQRVGHSHGHAALS